ncbi:MAG: hypothetical protein H6Q58_566 [Firmicutes bacterium]|nr:hypothetical protein [Bacillota bacterium]
MHNAVCVKRRGFVLVYTILIASLCCAAAVACFRLEILSRDNNIAWLKLMQKTDFVQKDREYLLTDIDAFITSGTREPGCEDIRELFLNESGFRSCSGESSAVYLAAKDAFYLCYYSGGKFVMEELYRYSCGEKGVVYIPAEFSYKKGIVAQ